MRAIHFALVVAILSSLTPGIEAAAQNSPDSISMLRVPGDTGPYFIVTLTRDGRVRYTDRLLKPPVHAEWPVTKAVADTLWQLYASLGIDSLLFANQQGYILGCVGGIADAPAIQITVFALGRHRAGAVQLPCSMPFEPDSLAITVRQFYAFVDRFERLTGAAERWRADHPRDSVEPPNHALLPSPHTFVVCCAALRQRSDNRVRRSRTLSR